MKILTHENNTQTFIQIIYFEKYIEAKTKYLQEFGYATLTKKEVGIQLEKILNGEKLDIIGMFMEKDIVKE